MWNISPFILNVRNILQNIVSLAKHVMYMNNVMIAGPI